MKIRRNKTLENMQTTLAAMNEKNLMSLKALAKAADTTPSRIKGLILQGLLMPNYVRPSGSKGRQDVRYGFDVRALNFVKQALRESKKSWPSPTSVLDPRTNEFVSGPKESK